MSLHHHPLRPTPKTVQRIERAFRKLHRLLGLIERRAAPSDIERAERSYRRSLEGLEVSEHELVRHYPQYRFATLAREAAERAGRVTALTILTGELN